MPAERLSGIYSATKSPSIPFNGGTGTALATSRVEPQITQSNVEWPSRAAYLAHLAIPLPWAYHPFVDELYADLTADAGEADRALAALAHVVSWAVSHRHVFHGQHSSNPSRSYAPSGGWAGRWDKGVGWEWIAFYQHLLDKILKDNGFEAPAVLRTWRDRGWLRTNPGRLNLRVRVDGDSVQMIAIERSAVASVMDIEADSVPASGQAAPRLGAATVTQGLPASGVHGV